MSKKSKLVKKRSGAPYKHNYAQGDIYKALEETKKGTSTWKVASMYNIPRSTLYAKLKGRNPVEAKKGPDTYLSEDQEGILVEWILYCSTRGFPITRNQLLDCVQKLVTELKIKTPFKNNRPGPSWFRGFCNVRHQEISERVVQHLNTSRAAASETVLRKWFSDVQSHLESLNLVNIDATRVYNLDESAFFLVPKADRVLARRGSKAVYKVVHGDEKESKTVLFTISASGVMLPPMILYWYERIPAAVMNNLPSEWTVGCTERGWMTGDSIYSYIKKRC